MKVIWIIFIFFLIVGLIFATYSALFTGNREFAAAALANNETFVGETSNAWPTVWFVAIVTLVGGVLIAAFRR